VQLPQLLLAYIGNIFYYQHLVLDELNGEKIVMEETGKIELFDPSILLARSEEYAQELLEKVQLTLKNPAVFPNIMTKLNQHVNNRLVKMVAVDELTELCTLMPDIKQESYDPLPLVPVCDLFAEQIANIKSADQLDPESDLLLPLNMQIDRLARLSEELKNDAKIAELLDQLIEYYVSFREALCKLAADKELLLSSKPYVSSMDLPPCEISQEKGLEFLVRNEDGSDDGEKGSVAKHPVKLTQYFAFKPNSIANSELYLETGQEIIIGKLFQIFDREHCVAAPVTLFKVGHVWFKRTDKFPKEIESLLKYYNGIPYMERLVQVARRCDFENLLRVFELQEVFNYWLKAHSKEKLINLLANHDDPAITEILKTSSGLDVKSQEDVPKYLKSMQRLIKDYTPAKAVEEIPTLMSNVDPYSLCSAILSYVVANTTDAKADNIMLCWHDDANTGKRSFYFQGIDNDKGFNHPMTKGGSGKHYITLRCILLFLNLDIPFDKKFREQFLSILPIYYLLTWLQSFNNDEKKFADRVEQGVITENDLFEEGEPAIDRPLKFHKATLPRMLSLLTKARNILLDEKYQDITLGQFVAKLMPSGAAYHQKLAVDKDQIPLSPLAAFDAFNKGDPVEELLTPAELALDDIKDELAKSNFSAIDAANNKTLLPKQAVAELLKTYKATSLPETLKLLEYLGKYHPYLDFEALSYSKQEINELMFAVPKYLLPNMLDLLLRCGGDYNAKVNGETILFKILSRPDLGSFLEKERIVLSLLNKHKIDMETPNNKDMTPLIAFISNAEGHPVEFVQFVIGRFTQKGVSPNKLTVGGTALDAAIKLNSVKLFSCLVSYGAYIVKDIDRAMSFLMEHAKEEEVIASRKILLSYNIELRHRWVILQMVSSGRDGGEASTIIGEIHDKILLRSEISRQIFDSQGNFLIKEAAAVGDFKIIKVRFVCEDGIEVQADVAGFPIESGVNFLESRLHQAFASYTAPFNEIFQCMNNRGEVFPILITTPQCGMPLTEVLKDEDLRQKVFANIDRGNLTKFWFIQLLTWQVKGVAEHVMVTPTLIQGHTRYSFSYVHNGNISFSPNRMAEEVIPLDKMFTYLHSFLDIPFDPLAIDELLNGDSREILRGLLKKLNIHVNRKSDLFSLSNKMPANSPRGINLSLNGIPIGPGAVTMLFVMTNTLRDILKKNGYSPNFTARDWLQCLQFLVARKTKIEAEIIPLSPGRAPIADVAMAKSPRMRTFTDSPSKLPVRKPPDMPAARNHEADKKQPYTILKAFRELSKIDQDYSMFEDAKKDILKGDFKKFSELSSPVYMQDAVNLIPWKECQANGSAETILEGVSKKINNSTNLVFSQCPVFTDESAIKVLKKCPGLLCLNLSGSDGFTSAIFKALAKYCPYIEEIIVNGTLITSLDVSELRYLRKLTAVGCAKLIEVTTNSELVELNLNSSAVAKINVPNKSHLAKLFINKCDNINPENIKEVLASSSFWQDFQCNSANLSIDLGPYVWSILRDAASTPSNVRSLLQDGALKFYAAPLADEQLHRIIEELKSQRRLKTQGSDEKLLSEVAVQSPNPNPIRTIDLTGCQNISRKATAIALKNIRELEYLTCQFSLQPNKKSPPIEIKGNGANIVKILALPNGLLMFFYENATFQLCNLEGLDTQKIKLIGSKVKLSGTLGTRLTDADLMPNGDFVVCVDGQAAILDAQTGKLGEAIQCDSYKISGVKLAMVVGNRWLILGGHFINVIEIKDNTLVQYKTYPHHNVSAMAFTPNQKTVLIQTEKIGTLVWNIDSNTTEYVHKDCSGEITALRVIDNTKAMLLGSSPKNNILLTLGAKQITPNSRYSMANLGALSRGSRHPVEDGRWAEMVNPLKAIMDRNFATKLYDLSAPVLSDPCIISGGRMVLNLGKKAVVVTNRCPRISMTFSDQLPPSLKVTLHRSQQYANFIQIDYPADLSIIQREAVTNLKNFIGEFFDSTVFKVVYENTAIKIGNIPQEEISIYREMLASFVLRSKEAQKLSLMAKPALQRKPTMTLKQLKTSKSPRDDMSIDRENSTDTLLLGEPFAISKFFEFTIHHGICTGELNSKNPSVKTLAQILFEGQYPELPPKKQRSQVDLKTPSGSEDEASSADEAGPDDDKTKLVKEPKSAKLLRRSKELFTNIKKKVNLSSSRRRSAAHSQSEQDESDTDHSIDEPPRKAASAIYDSASDAEAKDSPSRPEWQRGLTQKASAMPRKENVESPLAYPYFEDLFSKRAVAELRLALMLMGSAEGGPEQYRISSIDKNGIIEHLLERHCDAQAFTVSTPSGGAQGVEILFLLDDMLAPVDEDAKQTLMGITDEQLEKYFTLLFKMKISLPEGWAEAVYLRLKTMQQVLDQPMATNFDVLREVDPQRYEFYMPTFKIKTVVGRYKSVLLNLTKILKPVKISAEQQLQNFKTVRANWNKNQGVRQQLRLGRTESFFQLPPNSGQEGILNGLTLQDVKQSEALKMLTHYSGNLTQLNLGSCPWVDNSIFTVLSTHCRRLSKLDLSGTKVTTLDAPMGVTHLTLSRTKVNNTIFDQITRNCSDLDTLKIDYTEVTDIPCAINVRHFDLSGCKVAEPIFGRLHKYAEHLRTLKITIDFPFINFNEVSHLDVLDVSGSKGLQSIVSGPYYDQLHSEHCWVENPPAKIQVLRTDDSANLRTINISDASTLTSLYANNCALVKLSLSAGKELSALAILEISNNPNLVEWQVNPATISRFLASNCLLLSAKINAALRLRLLDQGLRSREAAGGPLSTSAMSLLLHVDPNPVVFATGQRGDSVFNGINVPGLDASYARFAHAQVCAANFAMGNFTGADLSGTRFFKVNFQGASFGQLSLFKDHVHPILVVAHNKELQIFASADSEGRLVLRNNEKVLEIIHLHQSIFALAISPDGSQLAVAGLCCGQSKLDAACLEKVSQMLANINPPRGNKIVGVDDRFLIHVYEINVHRDKPLTLQSSNYAHSSDITALNYTPNGLSLISASKEGKIKIFNTKSGQFQTLIEEFPQVTTAAMKQGRFALRPLAAIQSLSAHINNKLLAAGDAEGNIIVWNALQVVVHVATIKAHDNGIKQLEFSSDGKFIASVGGEDRLVKIWNVGGNWQSKMVLSGHSKPVNCVAFSPDNQFVFSAESANSNDQHIIIVWRLNYKLETAQIAQRFYIEGPVRTLDIDPKQITDNNCPAWVIRVSTATLVRRFIFHDRGLTQQPRLTLMNTLFNVKNTKFKDCTGLAKDQVVFLEQSGARFFNAGDVEEADIKPPKVKVKVTPLCLPK
jgi:WD40 repeat protein/uncharacterized protein YjbI with pentapeptide repeats